MRYPFYALRHASAQLPSICDVCGRWPAQPICTACRARFVPAQSPDTSALLRDAPGQPSPLQSCVAAVDYAYPWDNVIAQFKFRAQPGWAPTLAHIMLQNPQTLPLLHSCDCIVPIPLMPQRLASRGYNQAWELIKALRPQAARNQTPQGQALADALVRLHQTPDQHTLSGPERQRNLQGAFAVHPSHAPRVAGAHVLLVDDVTTTGATLRCAAQALLQAGASQVSALVFARTAPD